MIRRGFSILLATALGMGLLVGPNRMARADSPPTIPRISNIGLSVNGGVVTVYLCVLPGTAPGVGTPLGGGVTIDPTSNPGQVIHASIVYNGEGCGSGAYLVQATFSNLPAGTYNFGSAIIVLHGTGLPAGATPQTAFVPNASGDNVLKDCPTIFNVDTTVNQATQGCAGPGVVGDINGGSLPAPPTTPAAPPTTPAAPPTTPTPPPATPTNTPTNTPILLLVTPTTTAVTPAATTTTTAVSGGIGNPTPTPRPVPQPWFGPAQAHAFFAEGYTGLGYHQYLSLLNPGTKMLRTQVTIYRANGATRLVPLRLAPLTRRTLDVNTIAPRMSTALRVEADGPVVAERAQYYGSGSGTGSGSGSGAGPGNGQIVGGAALPRTRWYVAEGYVGGGFVDGLRLFNPTDVPARITIAASGSNGSTRLSHRVVPAATRLNVALDDVAPPGGTALAVQSSVPIVVESVVRAAQSSGPSGALAVATPSRLWYFPDGSTAHGSQEYISLFNPNGVSTAVHFHAVTAQGYQPPLTIHVRPHARAVLVVQGLIHRPKLAAIVGADHPIVAQEVRYTPAGALSVVNGAPYAVSSWAFAEGYVGAGFHEWLSVLNPSMCLAHISVRLVGRTGVVRTVTLSVRARHHAYLYVNGLMPAGPAAAIIHADYPIVAGRTLSFNAGRGLSTTIGVALQISS